MHCFSKAEAALLAGSRELQLVYPVYCDRDRKFSLLSASEVPLEHCILLTLILVHNLVFVHKHACTALSVNPQTLSFTHLFLETVYFFFSSGLKLAK